MALDIFIGTVIFSAPEYGYAYVSLASGAPYTTEALPAALPTADSSTGTVECMPITEGSTVICARMPYDNTKAYIQGVVNDTITDSKDTLNWRADYWIDTFSKTDSNIVTDILNNVLTEAEIELFKNRAHSVDRDAIAGDYNLLDKNKAVGMHIGRAIVQLRGSPFAYIDLSSNTHAIRFVADRLETHMTAHMEKRTHDYAVSDTAATESEGFGVVKGQALDIQNDEPVLKHPEAVPFFRIQHQEGALIDGTESVILGFPDDVTQHTTDKEPYILAKRRMELSGRISDYSAECLESVKTPLIRGVHQFGYGRKDLDDLLEQYEYKEDTSSKKNKAAGKAEKDILMDAALNKLADKLLSQEYSEKLMQRLAENGFSVSRKDNEIKCTGGEGPISGPTNDPSYGVPPKAQITDPVTGEKKTYYATSSFISQEPDGSVLICDGYGSEIRMSGGNIYISPALDLFLRPGRDLSAMVPRHQSYNSLNTCTINSSSSTYIRAVRSLRIAGATGGVGSVSVECMGTTGTADSVGGILIKSKTNAAFIGNDLYIGRNSGDSTSKRTVKQPDSSGTIIIDACMNGTVTEHSANHVIDTNSAVILANGDNNKGTAICVDYGEIGLQAKNILAPGNIRSVVFMDKPAVAVVRSGERKEITLQTDDSPSFIVQSHIIAGGDIRCNGGGKFNDGIAAKGLTPELYIGYYDDMEIEPLTTAIAYGTSAAQTLRQAASSVYQDFFVSSNAFAFPRSYSVPSTIRIPGMVWQDATREQTKSNPGAYRWSETYVENPDGTQTACYPGKDVWESASITQGGYKEDDKLKSGYVINTVNNTEGWE